MKPFFLFVVLLMITACSDHFASDAEKATAHLQKAKTHLSEQNFPYANIEIKNALALDPQNTEARAHYAYVLFHLNQHAASAQSFARAYKRCQSEKTTAGCNIPPGYQAIFAQSLFYTGAFSDIVALTDATDEPAETEKLAAIKALAWLQLNERDKAKALLDAIDISNDASLFVNVARASYQHEVTEQNQDTAALTLKDESPDKENILAWMLAGDIAYQQGKREEAVAAYTTFLSVNDWHPGVRFQRALSLFELNRIQEAQADVNTLLQFNKQDPGANYVKGLIEFANKRYDASVEALQLAMPISDAYPNIDFYLSNAYSMLSNDEQARYHAEKLHESFPGNVAAVKLLAKSLIMLERFNLAEDLVSDALASDENNVPLLSMLFDSLIAQDKTDEALQVANRLKALDTENASLDLRIAAGLIARGRLDDGLPILEQPTIRETYQKDVAPVLIDGYLRQNNVAKAKALLQQVDKDTFEPWVVPLLSGKIALAESRLSDAKGDFLRSVELEPANPEANHLLADMAMTEQNVTDAKKYLRNVLAGDASHLQTLLKLATLEAASQNPEGMASLLGSAIESHPKALQPKLLMARYYFAQNKPEKIPALFSSLNAQDQQRPEVLYEVGRAEVVIGNYNIARRALSQAVETVGDNPDYFFELALAYLGQGESGKALEALDQALQINPDFTAAKFKKVQVYIESEDFDLAQKHLDNLQDAHGSDPQLLSHEAALANAKGETEKLLALANQIYALQPNQDNLFKVVNASMKSDRKDMAISTMLAWLDDHPADNFTREVLAELYHRMGRDDLAAEQYKIVNDYQ